MTNTDNFITTTETADTATTLISSMLQMELANKAVLINTVLNKSSLVRKGDTKVSFPKSDRFVADDKVIGEATPFQKITLAVDTIDLNIHKHIPVRLEDRANMQSAVDLEPGIIQRMMSALVDAMETAVWTCIALASSSTPDHQIESDGYTIAAVDLLEAKRLLDVVKAPKEGRIAAVHANEVKDLLQIQNFISASHYPNSQSLINGEIGMVYGMKVVQHNVDAGAGKVAVYVPEHVAFAAQREPNFKMGDAPLQFIATDYSVDMLYGCQVMLDGYLGVVITKKTP